MRVDNEIRGRRRWQAGRVRAASPGRFAACLAIIVMVMSWAQELRAEYRLASGDVIEVSIFGRSELSRKTTVNVDGNISLPLIGEIHVTGLTLSALRSRVSALYAPGQSLRPSDIMIELAETRPFYVAGEIQRPGAYPYRAGLTVLHAVALAGGVTRRLEERFSAGPELGSRLAALRAEYVKQQIRIASLTAELEERSAVDPERLRRHLQGMQVEQIAELESEALRAQTAEREREAQYLRRAITLADEQIGALQEGLKEETEGSRLQAADLQRIIDLNRRGLTSQARVSEEQRAASLLKSRQMDTSARLARALQDKEALVRMLDKVNDRKVRVPRELQEAIVSLEGLRAQLHALASFMETSALPPPERLATAPTFEILRMRNGKAAWLAATEETPIEPDDMIRVVKD